MRLIDLAVEHPGGWRDIIESIRRRWPDLAVEVAQPLWGRSNRIRDASGKEQYTLINRTARQGEDRRRYVLHEYLESLELPYSGMLAAEAIRCLQQAGLPVPGDEGWLLYADDWERRDARDR
jgi:hypothetical protein